MGTLSPYWKAQALMHEPKVVGSATVNKTGNSGKAKTLCDGQVKMRTEPDEIVSLPTVEEEGYRLCTAVYQGELHLKGKDN